MSLYVPGLISVIVFYVIFLLLGLWAAWKSRKSTNNIENVLLAKRSIGMLLGIFTMTGMLNYKTANISKDVPAIFLQIRCNICMKIAVSCKHVAG